MSSARVVSQIQFGNFRRKLEALSFVFGNYNLGVDLICYVSVAVFIGFMLGRRRITIARPMLAALVFLCGVFVIIPAVIFSSSSADRRLIVAIALVAVSSLHLSVRSWRELSAAAATIGSVYLLQIGIAQHSWAAYEPWTPKLSRRFSKGGGGEQCCGGCRSKRQLVSYQHTGRPVPPRAPAKRVSLAAILVARPEPRRAE